MLLKELPFFVKFIFSGEGDNNLCFSFTDPEILQYVTYTSTRTKIYDLKIGHELTIIEDVEIEHKIIITDIAIRQIFDNTDDHNYGVDSQDCNGYTGDPKPWIFSILANFKLVN